MIARTDQTNPLDRETWRRIRRQAAQLVGKAGFRPADREDIEQELALRVWQGLRNFNPEVGRAGAFQATVLKRAANSLLRLQNSRKRGNGHTHRSLPIAGEDPEDGSTNNMTGGVLGGIEPSHERDIDLAHDVAVVAGRLPDYLQRLVEQLKSHSAAEIASYTDVSPSTIYARIAKLRVAFTAADLKILSRRSDTLRAFCELNK